MLTIVILSFEKLKSTKFRGRMTKGITVIQRNMKIWLQHNWLVYSIINFQWDKYEEREVRAILSIRYIRGTPSSNITLNL